MRWLYGSGEAAAASIQTWRQIADYAVAVASAGATPRSVPMGLPGYQGGIGAPSSTSDDGVQKPLAAVFDVDETVLLNTGYEYWQALSGKGFDPAEWGQWERGGAGIAPPVPGAVTGIRRLREAGITVIFNTNRDTGSAAGTVAALEAAGVGPAVTRNAVPARRRCDGRPQGRTPRAIAETHCVIAWRATISAISPMSSTRTKARSRSAALGCARRLCAPVGQWLVPEPNPVYGAWQEGTIDQVFPPETRWQPQLGDAPAIMEE